MVAFKSNWIAQTLGKNHAVYNQLPKASSGSRGFIVSGCCDSWAGVLSKPLYEEFCMPYLNRISEEVNSVPNIVFAKGAHFSTQDLMESSYNAVGLGLDHESSRSA